MSEYHFKKIRVKQQILVKKIMLRKSIPRKKLHLEHNKCSRILKFG